jgi:ABC-type multidrug transport system ATPase subunit
MSELFLEALMQLFALLTDVKQEGEKGESRAKVAEFLARNLNNEFVEASLERYDFFIDKYHKNTYSESLSKREQQSTYNMGKLLYICDQLNQEMEVEEKYLLVGLMLNFIQKKLITREEDIFVDALAHHLKIEKDDYQCQKVFTLQGPHEVEDKSRLLLISGQTESPDPAIKHLYNPNQQVFVWVIHIRSTNTFLFRYSGERNLYLNGHKIEQNKAILLAPGGVIKTSRMNPVYYGSVAEKFIAREDKGRIVFRAIDVEYKFSNNQIGIHPFSFTGRSGQLVGVIGGSGTGKSTLLNVLNGNLKLSQGRILINGHELSKHNEELKGVIGYVPQDDLLKEELTVFENLYFNARFCFSHLSKSEINQVVEKALDEFDLVEARDLVVGSPINKILSGGQRKRLNIALELMREPSILFVDEPTSGLSSMDSEKVMVLLKRQTLKGKLVIINIHQPGSDLYKLIDKLLIIDKGGRIIYNGNPMDAIVYFKQLAHYVNPEERECYVCGNVKTEQPLRIIEARMVNPRGRLIRKRKVSPEEWYQQYIENFEEKFEWKRLPKLLNKTEKLPPNLYNIPGRSKQFLLYALRDALSKLKDKQYLLINLSIAPVLALILGFFTKYISGTPEDPSAYVFGLNVNLPAYLFMCVVVSIFIGLNVSAEEIIRDRRLQQRESFLNLSRSSYLNSKIMNLFIISAVQTMSFILIGNSILEVNSLTFNYWLILFSTACFANMLGLNISSGLNSVVAIYIMIPLILVPQLLFSGVIVRFEKLHQSIASDEFVPRIGDLMVSRWAYEALAVNQFANNHYQRLFFDLEQQKSAASYTSGVWIPALKQLNGQCHQLLEKNRPEALESHSKALHNELYQLMNEGRNQYRLANWILEHPQYDAATYWHIDSLLIAYRQSAQTQYTASVRAKDKQMNQLVEQYGSIDGVLAMKQKYHNEALEDMVRNKTELQQYKTFNNRIIQLRDPIYNTSGSKWGRSHFYAPVKHFAAFTMPTPLFNALVIWISTGLLYLALYLDVLRRIIRYFETFKLRRQNKKLQKVST